MVKELLAYFCCLASLSAAACWRPNANEDVLTAAMAMKGALDETDRATACIILGQFEAQRMPAAKGSSDCSH